MMLLLALALQDVEVRDLVALGQPVANINPVRIAAHPTSPTLLVLYLNGDLWEVDVDARTKRLFRSGESYFHEKRPKYLQALGLHIDAQGRAYVVVNERWEDVKPWRAQVVVYRLDGPKVEEVVTFAHPWGVGPYNHGACRIATGPDGWIYLGVGSRTDHGETGEKDFLDKNGETDLTAVLLRWDPKAPKVEVVCRGLRNPYGFDWDDRGRLIAGEHGPDANHPEELNWLRPGKHYGFPYVFGDGEAPMYKDAARAPEGMTFEPPIENLGPDARPSEVGYYSFHPHSAPCGMVFYRDGALPARYKGSFFVTRFGNFLGKEPVGFEVLNVRLVDRPDGRLAARCETFYKTSRRPIDVCLSRGRLFILEYDTVDDRRPSRVLEASAK
jgi:glucose/arabinose dehydrogenase